MAGLTHRFSGCRGKLSDKVGAAASAGGAEFIPIDVEPEAPEQ
jgi:hypothetical protein